MKIFKPTKWTITRSGREWECKIQGLTIDIYETPRMCCMRVFGKYKLTALFKAWWWLRKFNGPAERERVLAFRKSQGWETEWL